MVSNAADTAMHGRASQLLAGDNLTLIGSNQGYILWISIICYPPPQKKYRVLAKKMRFKAVYPVFDAIFLKYPNPKLVMKASTVQDNALYWSLFDRKRPYCFSILDSIDNKRRQTCALLCLYVHEVVTHFI